MIRLKHLLREMEDADLKRVLDKIRNKQFRFLAQGDNGRVYEIDGEDKVFKITQEPAEFEVAQALVDNHTKYTTFIPVYYTDDKNMYIMANAEELTPPIKQKLETFMQRFAAFARAEGGEVSIFDYLDADGARNEDPQVVNFIRALQTDIQRIGIADLDLDLDFKPDNVMLWNGKLVMVDW